MQALLGGVEIFTAWRKLSASTMSVNSASSENLRGGCRGFESGKISGDESMIEDLDLPSSLASPDHLAFIDPMIRGSMLSVSQRGGWLPQNANLDSFCFWTSKQLTCSSPKQHLPFWKIKRFCIIWNRSRRGRHSFHLDQFEEISFRVPLPHFLLFWTEISENVRHTTIN